MITTLRLVIVAKDERYSVRDVLGSNPRAWGSLHVNHANEPIADIANRHLAHSGTDVFGLCHADCRFDPETFGVFIDTAARGAVCGMVGRSRDGKYIWSKDVAEATPVSTLDCCAVFFRPDSGLRFDEETFDGFHCYVEDLCLKAYARGIPVVVPPAKAEHLEESTYLPAWQAEYRRYRTKLSDKWRGVRFETT